MSTKSSIFLTDDNEHCYNETLKHDGDKFRLCIEINLKNIKSFEIADDILFLDIKGDSDLASCLRNAKGVIK